LNKEILNHPLLQDDYSIEQAEALQLEWVQKLPLMEKEFDLKLIMHDIKWIVAVDISFPKMKDPVWGIACAVLWDLENNQEGDNELVKGDLNFQYTPGFLGFRESKLIARAILNLPQKPDVIMCDGHGIAHPRRFGEAVHLGLALKIPSFGVAKNPFFGRSDWKALQRKKGKMTPIWSKENDKITSETREIIGQSTCLADDRKPVFISRGFAFSLDGAIKISLETTFEHRQPEPLYLADHISREKLNAKF